MEITLKQKKLEAQNIWSFIFSKPKGLTFQAGQFLQLLLPHDNPDDRGIKRYFTIAASPSEDFLMVTTKIIKSSSTFKKALYDSEIGTSFEAVDPAGPFVLPQETIPCILIAGGIGVTPYRSMAKFCADKKLPIPLKLVYANKTPEETAYFDFFKNLEKENKFFRAFYTMTEPPRPQRLRVAMAGGEKSKMEWKGRVGRIDEALIKEVAGKSDKNLYYISGPDPMVESYKTLLNQMGILGERIRLDYFPGYENERV